MLSAVESRLPVLARRGAGDVELRAATADSRAVREATLFAAIPGGTVDGHRFIGQALERGAAAVLLRDWPEGGGPWPAGVAGLQVADPRRSLALAASALHGDPGLAMKVVGVTGTNGKTTTVAVLASIFRAAGMRAGTLGTVGIAWEGRDGIERRSPATHTTPEGPALFGALAAMRDDGVQALALELSSHALVQGRAAGLQLDVAAWSNLSRDHLDYHPSMEDYEAAKSLILREMLAQWAKAGATAVLNVDDPVVARHEGDWPRTWRVSARAASRQPGDRGAAAPVAAAAAVLAPLAEPKFSLAGIEADLTSPSGPLRLRTRLLGPHNLANCLLAGAAALAAGVPGEAVERGWAETRGAPGRLERVERADGRGPLVLVDYAHSPDALEKVLAALRPLLPPGGRIVTLFGCGGDRDAGKRPLMARAAALGSDELVLTSDNPRGEDPEAILDAAQAGLAGGSVPWTRISDRAEAIRFAVGRGGSLDLVLLAGKGHEDYQEIRGVRHPFEDREEGRTALVAWTDRHAPPPPPPLPRVHGGGVEEPP
jgi:UDP-N-acetylmuramoyl-L-alanyl-D-glutamate--2,6-diaminopimelate ligase